VNKNSYTPVTPEQGPGRVHGLPPPRHSGESRNPGFDLYKEEIQVLYNNYWMPDQVRHDGPKVIAPSMTCRLGDVTPSFRHREEASTPRHSGTGKKPAHSVIPAPGRKQHTPSFRHREETSTLRHSGVRRNPGFDFSIINNGFIHIHLGKK